MSGCPDCGAELQTPLGCTACGVLLVPQESATPFELLGQGLSYDIDQSALKKALLKLSRLTHPDFFAAAGAELRALAERNSAALNAAFETLSDDFKRADWLVRQLGGPAEGGERQMPQAFLIEVLEWNELLEEAQQSDQGSPQRGALDGLQATLSQERERAFAAIASKLESLPDDTDTLASVRRELNAVRYIDNTLGQIRTLRLTETA
jgi:molecular chaperone HscB